MATLKSAALVTRSMNWRETSRIITLFTRDYGRLDVIAKGVNRPGSPHGGILEPLNLVEAVVHFSDKRELQILNRAELETALAGIRSDLEKLGCALAVLELINTFFKDAGSSADFYDFTVYLLKTLEQARHSRVLLWFFMLKLASYLGFRPRFDRCGICGRETPGKAAGFSFASGALICSECASGGEAGHRLSAGVHTYLAQLQAVHYKKIAGMEAPRSGASEITAFLLAYLRWHTSEKLELKALEYYKL